MSELVRIERNYGCIAEYNRVLYEEDSREFEEKIKNSEHYKCNREKLKNADKVIYCCQDMCNKCKFADEDTQRDADDDMGLIICNYPNSECKAWKQELKERGLDFDGDNGKRIATVSVTRDISYLTDISTYLGMVSDFTFLTSLLKEAKSKFIINHDEFFFNPKFIFQVKNEYFLLTVYQTLEEENIGNITSLARSLHSI